MNAAKVLPFQSTFDRPELKPFLREFKAGDTLFKQGESGNTLFVITKGVVQLTAIRDEQELHISSLEPGHVLGEKAILGVKPHKRFFGARAKTDCAVLEFTADDFEKLETLAPSIALQIMHRVCRVSVDRLDRIDHLIKVLRPADNIDRLVYMIIHFSHFEGQKTAQGTKVHLPIDTVRYYMAMSPFEIETCLAELHKSNVLISLSNSDFLLKDQAALIAAIPHLKENIPTITAI
jgi:CRP/FNR family transcriptional regulator, cyclic AMP receptor protein